METNATETSYTNEEFSNTFIFIVAISGLVIVSVVSLLGTIGNGLVIWFVAFRMKKTVNSVWFLSLAIADFTFSLGQLFLLASEFIFVMDIRILRCTISFFSLNLNLTASVFQLTIISIDRYVCTVFPIWCQNHRTVRLAVIIAPIIWTVSLLYSLCILSAVHSSDSDASFQCFIWESAVELYTIIRFIIVFVLPFTVITFCNLVIFSRIRRNRRATSTKPFKVIAAVIISFFICCFPWHLFSLILLYHNINNWLFIGILVSTLLVYSNSCVNPFLYVFICRDVKEKFRSSIKPAFERAFAEDINLGDSERHTTVRRFVATQAMKQM